MLNGGDCDTKCLGKIFHTRVKSIQNEYHAIKQYPWDVSALKFTYRLGRSLYLMSEVTPQQICSEHPGYRDILDCLPYHKVSLEDV